MKLFQFIISTRFMGVLLLLFVISIGTATFIENSYDTITARVMIYNAKWFELILILLCINFFYNIKRYHLFSKKKLTILLLHIGWILILIGAGVTRYIGFEGIMVVHENESADYIYTSEPYFQVKAFDEEKQFIGSKKLFFTDLTSNYFDYKFKFPEKEDVSIQYKEFIPNAKQTIISDVKNGIKILELILPGREVLYLKDGDIKQVGGLAISFNNNENTEAIRFFDDDTILSIYSPFDLLRANMSSLTVQDRQKDQIPMDTLQRDILHIIGLRNLINVQGLQIMVKSLHNNASFEIESTMEDIPDALIVDVSVEDIKKEAVIYGGYGLRPISTVLEVGGIYFELSYGAKPISLPFKIQLKEFRLIKYPGSESPSSYESDVSIIDDRIGKKYDHNIFMNNVVDYDGYRFFQSSYDWSTQELKRSGSDPDITILSVNHDFWGTWITYIGYIILLIGFITTLTNPNSRFIKVRKEVITMRKQRLLTSLIFIPLLFSGNLNAQDHMPVRSTHANEFGHLLVQSVEGRIQPIHTLAYDVFHKVSKKDIFTLDSGLELDAMQVFLDMMIDPQFWSKQKIIYIKSGTGVSDSLGVVGKYASIVDFIDKKGNYKLQQQYKKSFNKEDSKKNVFDKELVKVNERFQILLQLIEKDLLTIFPINNDPNNKWVSWRHPAANKPIGNDKHKLQEITSTRILKAYLEDVLKARGSGDYSSANELLNILMPLQKSNASKKLLPSEGIVDLEIYYNKTNIFKRLKNTYGVLAVLLLIFSFIVALVSKRNTLFFKLIYWILWLLIGCLLLAFLYHTYALGLRWYITGHAPWSNGYEALTFIAWGGVLAGFIFIRNSKITLAATSLLAFFTLMTAGHSSFDPQLTNLQPVLKSYWLMIHVACITISYGFLGLGFILGLINLIIYLGKTRSNAVRLNTIITELTYINEMTLTIGLMVAAIGTFLGGVWASESWGRYWGWDAKETWALVIVLTYAIIIHFRLIPGLKGKFTFNVASVVGFSSVLMTFIGVNYYLSKGLHSYARGDTPVFPMWAWITIFLILSLIVLAGFRERRVKKKLIS